ncbi:MAG: peptidyl-prolyl cis-trans isomerase [Thermoleophilaceae bacterium]|nr:peptidyl-prolyl cis-trans isomerase [Thermoleophilaceae bacterium]
MSSLTSARSITAVAAVGLCAVAAGCGNSIPASGVAKVGDSTITKDEFNHWLKSAAAGQAQGNGAPAPDPPTYEKCVAGLKKQPTQPGAPKPDDAALKKQCTQAYDQLRDQVMQFLIQAEWVQQEAATRGVKVSEAEVKKIFDDQKKQAFPREADYAKFLKDSGMSEADILFRLKLEQLQTKLTQKVTDGKSDPSEAEIKAFYEKNPKQFAVPESRDVNLVLTKTEAKAKEAQSQLEDGKKFKAVAKKFSIDEATKSQGGKLSALTKGQQDKELEEAAFAADKGKLVGPIKAQFGYYVFRVADIKEATQPTLEEVKDRIKQQLKSTNEQKVLNDFVEDFRERYKDKTECSEDFRVAECGNAPKDEKNPPASGGQPSVPGQAPPGAPPGGAPQQVPPGAAPQQVPPGAPQQVPPGTPQQVPPGTAPPPAGAPQQVPPGAPPVDPAPQAPASP